MTNFIFRWQPLLAARPDMHRVWGRFDNERPGFDMNHLIMMVAAAFALVIVTALAWRYAARRGSRTFLSESPSRLFRELCSVHGISRGNRRLLKQLADERGLTNAALLFVEPQHFDASTLSTEMKASLNELRQLRNQIFG